MLSRLRSHSYPDIRRMATPRVHARLLSFTRLWAEERQGGMRLDSFSALYLAEEIERMKELLEKRISHASR